MCRLEKPSSLDDILKITVGIAQIREKVVVFRGVFSDEKGEVAAKGEITYVCVNTNNGRSAKISEEVRRRLENEILTQEI